MSFSLLGERVPGAGASTPPAAAPAAVHGDHSSTSLVAHGPAWSTAVQAEGPATIAYSDMEYIA
jgi:hypothetical protein